MTRPVTVAIPFAKCSDLIPAGIRAPVTGTPFPSGDTARDWMVFGVSEGASRVTANQRKEDALAIIEACEKRESEIARTFRRKR